MRPLRAATLADVAAAVVIVSVVFAAIGGGLYALLDAAGVRAAQAVAAAELDRAVEASATLGVWTDDPDLLAELDPDTQRSRCGQPAPAGGVSVAVQGCDDTEPPRRSTAPVAVGVAARSDEGCWLARRGGGAPGAPLSAYAFHADADDSDCNGLAALGLPDPQPNGPGVSFEQPLLLP